MDYKFIPNKDPADEELIRELETNLGYSLPADYREFLLTYNGPYHEPLDPDDNPDRSIGFDAQPSPPEPSQFWTINIFPSVSRAEGSYTIFNFYEAGHDWNHAKELLPIVRLSSNARVFLSIDGPYKGHVFMAGDKWLDQYNDDADEITIDHYQKIADSFTDFIAMIRLRPYEDGVIKPTELLQPAIPAEENNALKLACAFLILAFPLYAGFMHMSWLILPLLAISFTYAYVGQKWDLFKGSLKQNGLATLNKQLAVTYFTQFCVVGVFYLLALGLSTLIWETPDTNKLFDMPEAITAGLSLISVIAIGIINRQRV